MRVAVLVGASVVAACSVDTEPLGAGGLGGTVEEQFVLDFGGDVLTGLDIEAGGCDIPGVAALSGGPDLGAVQVGDVLIDEAGRPFAITAIDDTADQLSFEGECAEGNSTVSSIHRPAALVSGGAVGIGTSAPGAALAVTEVGATGVVARFAGDGTPETGKRATLVIQNLDETSAAGEIRFVDAADVPRWQVGTDGAGDGGQSFYLYDAVAEQTRLGINDEGFVSMVGPIALDFASMSSSRAAENQFTNLFLGGAITYQLDGTYDVRGDGVNNYWSAIKMDNNSGGAIRFFTAASTGGSNYPVAEAALGNYQRMIVTGAGVNVTGNIVASGSITPGSSRTLKRDIRDLGRKEALATLADLRAVRFRYKADPEPADEHLGFIAEDVPALVATEGRRGVDPSDIAAVLTRVVQAQERELTELRSEVEAQRRELDELKALVLTQNH